MKIKFYKITIDQNILIAKTWGVTLVYKKLPADNLRPSLYSMW